MQIIHQSVFDRWPVEDGSVQALITSPPYYSLRKYSIPDVVIGGDDKDCKHEWEEHERKPIGGKGVNANVGANRLIEANLRDGSYFSNFCIHCSAWQGQYGLEPDSRAYLEHTMLWLKEAWRVLKDDGCLFLNIADSYGSGFSTADNKYKAMVGCEPRFKPGNIKPKSKLLIPERLAIMAVDELGFILRNHIVWCLSGGTYVYVKTQKGEMPMMIRDMARLKPETIKLWNGEKWTQVLGLSKSKRKNTELEFVLRSGERISCTPNHKFPTERGLLEAKDIVRGDKLLSVKLPQPETPLTPELIPDDIAWFVGLYIAEGSRSGDCIQISGHVKEVDRYHLLSNIVNKYGGHIQRYNNGNNGQSINIHSKILNAIIGEYISGKTAKNKGLSVKCWQRNNDFLKQLLSGYLSGDGHWDRKNRRWRLGFTRNYNLERDLRVLCARLGYKLILNFGIAKIKDRQFPCFRGEIRIEQNNHHSCKNPNEVMGIRKARCREVYDIGVADGPHLFALASGILTHNSKPNAMPESVTDRFSKKWESIFMFVKQPKYYFNLDAVRKRHANCSDDDYEKAKQDINHGLGDVRNGDFKGKDYKQIHEKGLRSGGNLSAAYKYVPGNINGKNPGDVWNIPTQPSGKFKVSGDYVGLDGKPYKASLDCPICEHRLCAEKKQREQYDEQLTSSLNHISDNAIHPEQGLESESVSIHSHDVGQIKNEHFSEPKVHNMENHKISDEGEANSQNPHHNKHKNEKPASNSGFVVQQDSEIATSHNRQNHKKAPEPLTNQPYISFSEKVDDIDDKQVEHEIAEHTSRIDENNISEVSSLNEKGINGEGQIPSGILNISHINNNIAKCTCQQISDAHFAMWPEKLVERMILCSTRPGDVVLDPFCGSGTTGRVAIQHNRKFVGIDLGYEDIQHRRTKNIQKELAVR